MLTFEALSTAHPSIPFDEAQDRTQDEREGALRVSGLKEDLKVLC